MFFFFFSFVLSFTSSSFSRYDTYAWHLRTDDIIFMVVIRNKRERKKTKIDEKTYDASVLAFYLAMLYVRNYLIS